MVQSNSRNDSGVTPLGVTSRGSAVLGDGNRREEESVGKAMAMGSGQLTNGVLTSSGYRISILGRAEFACALATCNAARNQSSPGGSTVGPNDCGHVLVT